MDLGIPPEERILVAPGMVVGRAEYDLRFAGLDIDRLRRSMAPALFEAFVRHIGVIPGHPNLDINAVTDVPR